MGIRGSSSGFRRAAIAAMVCAGLAGLSVVYISAARDDPKAVPTASEVAARVMSPFCPGLSLDECPSGQSADLRAQIEDRVAGGATNSEIDRWLIENYGESVLARPPHAVSWMVPAAFVIAGLGAVSFLVSRGRTGRTQPQVESGKGDDANDTYRAQMLKDLSAFAEGTE